MIDESRADGVRYLDLTTAASVAIVTAAVWMNLDRRNAGDIWWLALFVASSFVAALNRRRIYAGNLGRLAAVWLVFLSAVFAWALWSAPLAWFVLAGGTGAAVLVLGLVAPFRLVRDRLTREEMFKVGAVIGSIILGACLAEVFVRLAPGMFDDETQQLLSATPANAGVGHPYIGHLHRPHRTMVIGGRDFRASHNVDGLGFRNRWPWPERADIVTLGDSFTFGFGVADHLAWPAVVARTTGSDVINLALIGAGPEQYFRVYETFGAKLQPQVLLVGVYSQNDFWDAGMFDQWLQHGAGENYMVWRSFGQPVRYDLSLRDPMAIASGLVRARLVPFVRSSHLFNFLRATRSERQGRVRTLDLGDEGRLQLLPDEFLLLTAGAHRGRREFDLVFGALMKIHSLAAERGTRTLIVLLPGKEQVYLPIAGEPVTDPAGDLRQALDAAGIEYLDLAPAFRERAAAGNRLFFEVDSHPNEAGHALIGELVTTYINRHATYGLGRRSQRAGGGPS